MSVYRTIGPLVSISGDSFLVQDLTDVRTHSCKFAQLIPMVPNGKYPHREFVICQTLLDWTGMHSADWDAL